MFSKEIEENLFDTSSIHYELYIEFIIERKRYEWIKDENQLRYIERHHILPTSLGGSDDEENLVYLSGEDHYTAHYLLYECTVSIAKEKMKLAFQGMTGHTNKVTGMDVKKYAKNYEILKIKSIKYSKQKEDKFLASMKNNGDYIRKSNAIENKNVFNTIIEINDRFILLEMAHENNNERKKDNKNKSKNKKRQKNIKKIAKYNVTKIVTFLDIKKDGLEIYYTCKPKIKERYEKGPLTYIYKSICISIDKNYLISGYSEDKISKGNRIKLLGVLETLRNIPLDNSIKFFITGEMYVHLVRYVEKYKWRINGWKNASGKTVENKDILEQIFELIDKRKNNGYRFKFLKYNKSNKNKDDLDFSLDLENSNKTEYSNMAIGQF